MPLDVPCRFQEADALLLTHQELLSRDLTYGQAV
jgi:hypothetical protein